MLGWGISIWRPIDPSGTPAHKRQGFIGGWEVAGLGHEGLEWIEELVSAGRALCLGGNGYPLTYKVRAPILAEALRSGVPRPGVGGTVIVGEDYATRGGTVTDFEIDWAVLDACRADEEVLVEAWDLS